MPTKGLETADVLEALKSQLAYIPGGRDREGRPLIVVNVPPELQPTTKPRLESLILYFLSIYSEETKKNGLSLIVDARRGAWRVARSCIRLSVILLGSQAASVVVVKPDGFWDKRVDSCTKSLKEGEPTYVTLNRLSAYADFSQLPYELGGNKAYDHTEWIQKRVKVETYTKDVTQLISKLKDLHQRLSSLDGIRMTESDDDLESYWEIGTKLTSEAGRILQAGRNLIGSLSRESSKDTLDTIKKIHGFLDSIELKQVDIENCWTAMERNLDTARVIEDLEKGVSRVTNWILGPADAMLNSCCRVGFDVSSSEELRRQHEKLELECRETYGRYAELLHKIDSLPSSRLPEDLKSQRDFMDFVCRSFASRLERRRNVLITSQRFFRLVSEYFDKTSEVFDKLVMSSRTHDFSQAGVKLSKLEKSQSVLETLERELVKEGEKLTDILSMPVKDALGREVQVDYGEDIANVRDILDATSARKTIFNDSVELQKLSLKQLSLIYTYESDAEQAVNWLNDLYDVLVENHLEIGCNANEIQSQKEEHQSFQETAKGTYDYGCQLVNGARVLRLSCRLPLENNASLFSRLRQAWKQLRSVGQEQLTRLRVCTVFHRNVEDHCASLRTLIDTVGSLRRAVKAEDLAAESRARTEIRDILGNREKLLVEVGRMVRLGRLLRTRLKEPLCHQRMSEAEDAPAKGSNLTAVEAISAKLAEVTRLAEKLDARLCEAGAKTRPVPISSGSWSSSPPSTSHTTISSSGLRASTSASMMSNGNVLATGSVSSIPGATGSAIPISVPLSTTLTTALSSPISSASTVDSEISRITSKEVSTLRDSFEVSDDTDRPAPREEPAGQREEVAQKENAEKIVVEDSNVDGYVTATECSTTPIARSRSASFVTSPECEELALASAASCSSVTWSNAETAKPVTAVSFVGEEETPKIEEQRTRIEVKEETSEENGVKPDRSVTMEKVTEEKSGKIVKEVTETTTLRVSHDTRLGIASYKVTSNTLHDHHESVDAREFRDTERTAVNGEMNGHIPSMQKESVRCIEASKQEPSQDQETTKLTEVHEVAQEETTHKILKDISLTLKEYSRHEDSGIEMSPTKREDKDSLEAEEFLEKARKVSSLNGEEAAVKCSCGQETTCCERHSLTLINEDHRLPLSNPS